MLPATTTKTSRPQHWLCVTAAPLMPPRCYSWRPQPLRFPHRPCLDADNEHPEHPFHALPQLLRPASYESPCGSARSLRLFFLASRVRRSSAHPCTSFLSREVPGLQMLNPSGPAQSDSPCFRASPPPAA